MLVAVDKNPNANAMEEDFAISKSCLDKKKKKKKPCSSLRAEYGLLQIRREDAKK